MNFYPRRRGGILYSGELSEAKEQLEAGEKQIKWRYVKSPEHLLSEIADLSVEKENIRHRTVWRCGMRILSRGRDRHQADRRQ